MRTAKGRAGNSGKDLTAKIKCESKKKSCDGCALKKRKCDGGNPCRRCLGAGEACSYSKRRPRLGGAQFPAAAAGPMASGGWASDQSIYGPATLPAGCDRNTVASVALPARPGESAALQQYGSMSLKRCRLSPSPATGLVGMQENEFLSDYFGCFSFLPFTSQSNIRETMVKLFAGSSSVGRSHSGDYSTVDQHFDPLTPADSELPVDPSICVFWSAIALGSLVQGRPVESVEKYSRLARGALTNVKGPASAEVARAWAILAYMSDFCGEHERFHEYLQRANRILCDVGEEEIETLPVGLAEVVKHGATIKLFTGNLDREEMESYCNQQRVHPQMSETATEGDICQFVMRSFRSLEQAIYENVVEDRAASAAHGCLGDGETGADTVASGGDAGVETLGHSHPLFLACLIRDQGPAPCPSSILDIMRKMMRKHASEFHRIEHAAAGPNIGGGIGGLIINGTLVFEKAARKDIPGALEKLEHCGDVLERYPGLCSFTMGAHMTHMLMANLILIDGPRAREIYDQMMTAYNSARRPGIQAFPPFDEWEGITTYCDNYYCRVIEQTIAREYSSASSSLPPQELAPEMQEEGPRDVPVHGRQQEGVPSATGSRKGAEGHSAFDTRPRQNIVDASISSQEPGRDPDEEPVRCVESISSDGWWTAQTKPPEPTRATPLCREVVSEPIVDSDVSRILDEQTKPGSCTEEVGAQAAEALLLSEFSPGGTLAGDETEYDAGIGVQDWLDVTHAMLDTSGLGLD